MRRWSTWLLFLAMLLMSNLTVFSNEKTAAPSSEPETVQDSDTEALPIKQTISQRVVSTKGFLGSKYEGVMEVFSANLSLNIVLGEVILLVILVNLFALFKKARLILAISYLFCFKWVFWSNYTRLLKHSDTVATVSAAIFVICGILTVVLFCLDRFNQE